MRRYETDHRLALRARPGPQRAMPAARLSTRQITEADFSSIATLLSRGFPKRKRKFWLAALEQLRSRSSPAGLPRYGYVFEADDLKVGVVLTVCSTSRLNDRMSTRCNLSSWYVEPKYRSYAAMFRSLVIADGDLTYLNISARPNTGRLSKRKAFRATATGCSSRRLHCVVCFRVPK
jgi:hypothetical protein